MIFLTPHELDTGLTAWREAVLRDPQARWDAGRDLRYWQQAAARFEDHRQPVPNTLATLKSLVRPEWSLLDVGAGTGRFTRPLAPYVRNVTALDYSADMLSVLLSSGLPLNATVVQREFHSPDIPVHDAVLAAWALYRSVDLRVDAMRLLSLAGRVLFVLDDNGLPSPHVAWKRKRTSVPWSRMALIAGVLQEEAEVEVVNIKEERSEMFQSVDALVARYKVESSLHNGFLQHMRPYLALSEEGVRYSFQAINTLIVARH